MSRKHIVLFIGLFLCVLLAFVLNLSYGSVAIPIDQTIQIIWGQPADKASWEYIVMGYRLPKAVVAILVGIALPISGMLMQTLFKNPMAEPYVLGLSSGASLGVALVILGSSFLPPFLQGLGTSPFIVTLASIIGTLWVLLVILLVLKKVKDTMTLLVIGLMFSSFTGALVGVFAFFSSAEELQKFTFWSMGSFGNQTWEGILMMAIGILIGLVWSVFTLKSLNALLLGENYAKSLGVDVEKNRYYIIIATALLAGTATAFAGPIAFVGLAIPHFTRVLFKTSSHHVLFIGNILIGSILLLISDTISQLPGSSFVLPINAITSLIGAPVVISILLKKRFY